MYIQMSSVIPFPEFRPQCLFHIDWISIFATFSAFNLLYLTHLSSDSYEKPPYISKLCETSTSANDNGSPQEILKEYFHTRFITEYIWLCVFKIKF